MTGGINNPALFGDNQRPAKTKLNMMAGIDDTPRGILASSPELMAAVQNNPLAQPQLPPIIPQMPPIPAAVSAPVLPQLPINTTVAPSLNPMAPAPVVPRPVSPNTPMPFNEGASVDMRQTYGDPFLNPGLTAQARNMKPNPGLTGALVGGVKKFMPQFPGDVPPEAVFSKRKSMQSRVDITKEATPLLFQLDAEAQIKAIDLYGSVVAAEAAVGKKLNTVKFAAEADPENDAALSDALTSAATDAPATDEDKIALAGFMGIDTTNIDELDKAYAQIALSGVGLGEKPAESRKAILNTILNFKQTAASRAAASVGTTKGYTTERLFQQAVQEIMSDPGQYDVYGESGQFVDPQKVRQQALQIANVTAQAMGGQPAATPSQTLLQQVQEALKLEPKRRKEILKQATDAGIDVKGL